MIWNPEATIETGNVVNISEGSDIAFTDAVCSVDNKSNSNGSGFLVEQGSNDMEGVIGISMDGVLLFPSVELDEDPYGNSGYVDPWFPDSKTKSDQTAYDATTYSVQEVDNCLGSISEAGEYRYRSASDCMSTETVQTAGAIC